MEVSLRGAGFTVSAAADGREALERCAASPPDLVVSEAHLRDVDGFELCRRVKADERLRGTPFIFLTGRRSLDDRVKALEAGVEDYLTKPIYLRELVARVKLLFERREAERLVHEVGPSSSGELGPLAVVDLVQAMERGRQSGALRVEDRRGRAGVAWFRAGRVVDCEWGALAGLPAFHRILDVAEGRFAVEGGPVERAERIAGSTEALLLEAMGRLEAWARAAEALPPLDAVGRLDFRVLADRLGEIPDHLNALLRLFDGRRPLGEVIEESDRDRVELARVVAKLLAEGIVEVGPRRGAERGRAPPPRGAPAHEAEWFAGPTSVAARPAEAPPRIVRFPAKPRAHAAQRPAFLAPAPPEAPPALPTPEAAPAGAAPPADGAAPGEPAPASAAAVRRGRGAKLTAAALLACAAAGAYGFSAARERRLVRAEQSYRAALESAGRRYAAGDLAGAVEDYRRAAAARETGAALTGLGRALYDVRQRGPALDALARAIEVDAGHAEAYIALGDIYMLENQPAEARRAYERYLVLAPKGGRAGEVRALLARIK